MVMLMVFHAKDYTIDMDYLLKDITSNPVTRRLFDAMPGALAITRFRDGCFIFVNCVWQRMFGHQPTEVIGKTPYQLNIFTHPIRRESYTRILTRKHQLWNRSKLRHKDGSEIDVIIFMQSLAINSRHYIVSSLLPIEPVTQKLHDHPNLKKAHPVMQLIYGSMHDIKNAMAIINASGKLIKNMSETDSDINTACNKIISNATRCADLVRGIQRRTTSYANFKIIDLCDTLHELIFMLEKCFPKSIHLTHDISAKQIPVLVDINELEIVLTSIACNARNAMPNGGELRFSIGRTTLDDFCSGQYVSPGEYAEILISDTGIGMGQEIRQHAFEPFYTNNNTNGHSGLGLPVARSIIRMFGGDITIQSTPGTGTVVRILLPLAADHEASIVSLPRAHHDLRKRVELDAAANVTKRSSYTRHKRVISTTSISTLPLNILVIDDEPAICDLLQAHFSCAGHNVATANTGKTGLALLGKDKFDILLIDVHMPDMNGFEVVKHSQNIRPESACIMMTGYPNTEDSIAAIEAGCEDYLAKPISLEHLDLVIARTVYHTRIRQGLHQLTAMHHHRNRLCGLVGSSQLMNEIYRKIKAAAQCNMTTLIHGETGTGKGLAAKAIHQLSPNATGPMISINCGSLPASILESELFGHIRGAFTGATSNKQGAFAAANNGTIFLDEIEAASSQLQIALLKVLDQHEITPVGTHESIPLNIRVIAASNMNLEAMVEAKTFREDLFYRLAEMNLHMPPLRSISEDIPMIASHFLEQATVDSGKRLRTLSSQTQRILKQYSWPGNVRELRNLMNNLAYHASRPLVRPSDLPVKFQKESSRSSRPTTFHKNRKKLLEEALQKASGNKAEAARILGISRRNIYNLIKKYKLE